MTRNSPVPSSPEVRERMQRVRRRDTKCEVAIRRILHAQGFRYRVDERPERAIRRRADLVFVRQRVAVFVDGCFWHGCPQHATWPKANGAWWREKILGNVRRDRDTDRRLRGAGWTVVRVWEHESPEKAAARIGRVVRRREAVLQPQAR